MLRAGGVQVTSITEAADDTPAGNLTEELIELIDRQCRPVVNWLSVGSG